MPRKKAKAAEQPADAAAVNAMQAEDPTEFDPRKLEQESAAAHAGTAGAVLPEQRQPGEDPPEAPSAAQAFVAVQAPPPGDGRPYTLDQRIGYRKEDSPDGKKRQIRFANRPSGERPDDELLEPLRKRKPDVSWSAREKAWQASKTPEGLQAIDEADQELADIGRKRSEGRPR